MKIAVSILICTCNRAEMLAQTLQSMRQVRVPSALPAELIVIDNASTDQTAKVVEACDLPQMTVHYMYEAKRGQVRARNAGLAAAQGDIILFTDDDVRPDVNWIADMCEPLLSGAGQAVAGGVRFAPYLKRGWMELRHRGYLADTTVLEAQGVISMIGANMGFSKEALSRVPRFDPELGPGAMGFCDDSLFTLQLREAGYKIASALDVSVEHHFDAARLSRASFGDRAIKEGRSTAYVSHHWDHYEVPRPEMKLLHARITFALGQRRHAARWPHAEGMSLWEMERLYKIGFWQQYIKERKRPRNYTLKGLVKIAGIDSGRI